MIWPFHTKTSSKYWLKVFLFYVAFEASIQLLYFFTLNTFQSPPISDLEFHFIMWSFQCVLIWPIWYVAFVFRKQQLSIQVVSNMIFFVLYTLFWFEVVQHWIEHFHIQLQQITKPETSRLKTPIDTWDYFHYQVLKHSFRLGCFFAAGFFYRYKKEEQQTMQLAVTNKELQLNLLKWHLNPDFFFKTMNNISLKAKASPKDCSKLILILSKVMEFVIYRSKEKFIPVEEELAFFNNYIFLQNLDKTSCYSYTIRVSGNYSNMQIIPLLLISLTESRRQSERYAADHERLINVSFENQNMKVNIESGHKVSNSKGILINEPLLARLEEFYKNRYWLRANNEKEYCFEIQLNTIA